MSELAKMGGVARTDVLPGHTIARARLSDFGQAEEEFERRHIAKAGAAAVGLPDAIADKIIAAATDDVASGRFKYGRWAFDAHAKSPTALPFLLFLLLRHAHSDITREKAADLVSDQNESAVNRAVLIQFGYNFDKQVDDSKNGQGVKMSAQSIGQTSSPS